MGLAGTPIRLVAYFCHGNTGVTARIPGAAVPATCFCWSDWSRWCSGRSGNDWSRWCRDSVFAYRFAWVGTISVHPRRNRIRGTPKSEFDFFCTILCRRKLITSMCSYLALIRLVKPGHSHIHLPQVDVNTVRRKQGAYSSAIPINLRRHQADVFIRYQGC